MDLAYVWAVIKAPKSLTDAPTVGIFSCVDVCSRIDLVVCFWSGCKCRAGCMQGSWMLILSLASVRCLGNSLFCQGTVTNSSYFDHKDVLISHGLGKSHMRNESGWIENNQWICHWDYPWMQASMMFDFIWRHNLGYHGLTLLTTAKPEERFWHSIVWICREVLWYSVGTQGAQVTEGWIILHLLACIMCMIIEKIVIVKDEHHIQACAYIRKLPKSHDNYFWYLLKAFVVRM